ncbi:MAG: alpha-L-fucosidase [Bacteroidales bacterium]
MKFKMTFLIILMFLMGSCNSSKKKNEVFTQTFEPTWESLINNDIPEWLLDAKFGIYAHWGVYAVPAYFTEHYGKRMHKIGDHVYEHHLENWGDPSEFSYKEFIPMFKAEKYDPAEWVEIIKQSGAKYAGLATVHHDGFCIWDSEFTKWNSMDMGPKRDLFGEFAAELKKNEMPVIATFHHIRTFNWYLPWIGNYWQPVDSVEREKYLDKDWDIFNPEYGDLYWNDEVGRTREDFLVEWKNKVTEVLDNYEPDIIWFDGGAFRDETADNPVQEILAYYYNKQVEWQKPVVVLNKFPGSMEFNFPYELGILSFEEGRDRNANETRPWIDDMKIAHQGWGYNTDQIYKKAPEIVRGLIDRVSRGGGLLLNLSPKADGTIPEAQKEALRGVGKWLEVNGEAIFETRPWKIHAEGLEEKLRTPKPHPKWNFTDNIDARDIRFTVKDNNLYVMALSWPEDMHLHIKSIHSNDEIVDRIKNVQLLGSTKKVEWSVEEDGTHVVLPEVLNDVAVALKFTLSK